LEKIEINQEEDTDLFESKYKEDWCKNKIKRWK
jgi:hypothetical protein